MDIERLKAQIEATLSDAFHNAKGDIASLVDDIIEEANCKGYDKGYEDGHGAGFKEGQESEE